MRRSSSPGTIVKEIVNAYMQDRCSVGELLMKRERKKEKLELIGEILSQMVLQYSKKQITYKVFTNDLYIFRKGIMFYMLEDRPYSEKGFVFEMTIHCGAILNALANMELADEENIQIELAI